MSKAKARRNWRRYHKPESERRAASYEWRDEIAKALVVDESLGQAVADGSVTPTEAERARQANELLWDNPPFPISDSERRELFTKIAPKRRFERRLERAWEDGTEPAATFARVADGYRQQLHQWLREGWITSESAKRLNAVLDSDDPDRFLRVPEELKAARAGRQLRVGVRYDKYGCPHPTEDLPA